jgi:hypothetical protein
MVGKFRQYYKLVSRLEYTEGGFAPYRGGEVPLAVELPTDIENFYEEVFVDSGELDQLRKLETLEDIAGARPIRKMVNHRGTSPPPPQFAEFRSTKHMRIGAQKLVAGVSEVIKSYLQQIGVFDKKKTKRSLHRRIYSMPLSLQFMASKKVTG